MIYGYARVSTDGQTLDAPRTALLAASAEKVFQETASGAKTDRRELAKALKALNAGDVLLVTRLARSTRDLLNILDTIAKAGAGFRSIADTWADTTTPHGRLMLTVLGGLAEFERELIRARTGEGRTRAKARGVKMGPKFKLTPEQRRHVAQERAKGESVRHLARVLGVSKATIARIEPTESQSDDVNRPRIVGGHLV
jgi:DNA invertase Pin-like site-specific DNA recombinase